MDRFDTSKNYCFIIIIVSILLMVQEIKTRSTWKLTSDNHQSLHSVLRSTNMRHLRSRFHSHSASSQSMDASHAKSAHLTHHKHHLLKKRHDSGGVKSVTMDEDVKRGLQLKERNLQRKYDVQVREAQNRSLCNYTVTPVEGLEYPKDLVNITCNKRGSRCQANNAYCCIQTYTNIKVKKGGKIEVRRINTGCVCALQLFGVFEKDQAHPEINL